MAKSHNQKAKILFLAQMLYDTGENRTISMQDILANLTEQGINAERKSIYDDFEALRAFGLEVKFKRGRPGGYYVSEKKASVNFLEGESEKAEGEISGAGWNLSESDKKPMRLLCSKEKEEEIKAYFGTNAEYKEKDEEYFLVTVPQSSDVQFFGWLTAMGKAVYIVKPKKVAAAYRDYLKTLVKEYKGI